MQMTWTHLRTLAGSTSWYCNLITLWVNQKSYETLNYTWAKMIASLINLSSLHLAAGGGREGEEAQILNLLNTYVIAAIIISQMRLCSSILLRRAVPLHYRWQLEHCTVCSATSHQGIWLPPPLAKPYLKILYAVRSTVISQSESQMANRHTHLSFRLDRLFWE